MAGWDGNGNFIREYNWTDDKTNNIKVRADRFDDENDNFATGLENCITRDNQTPPTENISWGAKKITNLADGTAVTDAATIGNTIQGANTYAVDSVVADTLIVDEMTDNTTPVGYTISDSASSADAYKIFDRILTGANYGRINATSAWWKAQIPVAKVCIKYSVLAMDDDALKLPECPKDWTFEGSNTGAFGGEEVVLDTITSEEDWYLGEERHFNFTNTTAYLYYRLNVSDNNGGSYTTITELTLQELNTVEASLPIAPTLAAGLSADIKIANTNTAATTLDLNGTGVKNILLEGNVLEGGELVADYVYRFVYDGTQYNLIKSWTPQANESRLGLSKKATQTEVDNLTESTKYVTPLTLGGYFDSVKIPVWTKYTVTYSDLATVATTNSITLYTAVAKAMIHHVVVKHSQAFSGGSLSAYTVEVGLTGNTTKYAPAFDVFQAVADTAASNDRNDFIESFASTTAVKITADSTGDDLDNAAAGSVDVWVLQSVLN